MVHGDLHKILRNFTSDQIQIENVFEMFFNYLARRSLCEIINSTLDTLLRRGSSVNANDFQHARTLISDDKEPLRRRVPLWVCHSSMVVTNFVPKAFTSLAH